MDDLRCKETVYPNERWGSFYPHQCEKKIWKDGYCKIHHPDTVAEMRRKSDEQYKIKQKQSAWYLLGEAQKRIQELELEIEKLRSIHSPPT